MKHKIYLRYNDKEYRFNWHKPNWGLGILIVLMVNLFLFGMLPSWGEVGECTNETGFNTVFTMLFVMGVPYLLGRLD